LDNKRFSFYITFYLKDEKTSETKIKTIKYQQELDSDKISSIVVKKSLDKYLMKESLIGKTLPIECSKSTLIDTANNEINLLELINENKGKVIYLDFWATWCKPCRMEMPYSKTLKETLKDEPIEFIYLTTHEPDTKNWDLVFKATSTNKGHYHIIDGTESYFLKFMEITGIPHYMIFDKEGKLVDFNATRPSNLETEKRLRKLIKQ
jgi:thiol-disulfide isomerase/thioredoxin